MLSKFIKLQTAAVFFSFVMKNSFTFLLLFTAGSITAQTHLFGPTLSYQSQSGNMGKVGAYYLRSADISYSAYKIDITANFAYFSNQFLVIPEAGFTFYPYDQSLILPMVEAEITPYTLTPKVGFSLLSIIDFSFGYGFGLHTKKEMKPLKGFTFSLGVSIPVNAF